MDDSVKKYRSRRRARLNTKKAVHMDAVEAYRERRQKRLEARFDASARLAYGIAKSMGINTEGMEPQEVWEAIKKKDPGAAKVAMKGYGNRKPKGNVTEKSGKQGKVVVKGGNKKSDPKNDRKHQECDGTGYKGKAGEVKTGIGGKLKPKSDAAKRIDTADAMAETRLFAQTGGKKGIAKNSLSDHIDENGNLSPERQKIHDEIVQNYFKNLKSYDGQATMIMSGGGPASGKSFVSDGAKSQFGAETVAVVDPDAIKAMLPGFADMAVAGDKAAGFYHEESSALAKRIYQYACDNNINVVYDGTGDGSVNSVRKKLKLAQDSGYAVRGEYVTVNVDDVDGMAGALTRNRGRYEHAVKDWNAGRQDMDPPRLVGDRHVRDIHAKVSDIAPDVANMFDEWVLTDNNVPKGAKRPVIAKCKKGGEIEVVKGMEKKVQDWLDKGTRGGKVVNGKIVFPASK